MRRYHSYLGPAFHFSFMSLGKHDACYARARANGRSNACAFASADYAAKHCASDSAAADIRDVAFVRGIPAYFAFGINLGGARVLELGQRAVERVLCSIRQDDGIELHAKLPFTAARASSGD